MRLCHLGLARRLAESLCLTIATTSLYSPDSWEFLTLCRLNNIGHLQIPVEGVGQFHLAWGLALDVEQGRFHFGPVDRWEQSKCQ